MKRAHRSLRGLRQCDSELGASPRYGRPGDRDEDVELGTQLFTPIDPSRDRNRERAAELHRTPRDLLIEDAAVRCLLAANDKQAVPLSRLSADGFLGGLLDPSCNFGTVIPLLRRRRLVAGVCALLDERCGLLGLPCSLQWGVGCDIGQMKHRRGEAPSTG